MNHNNNTQSFTQQTQKQNCSQCLTSHPLQKLIYMAEFLSYICQQCYKQQSTALMLYKNAKPTLYPQVNQIIQGLYLGNQDAACDQQTITKLNIHAVCVCGDYLLKPFTQKLMYKQFEIADSLQQQIIHMFDQSHQYIENLIKQKKNVLVHCAAGVSRSASFVIAYLMKSQKISYIDAYTLVKSKRSIIKPNSNFVKQLYDYEKRLIQLSLTQNVKEQ